MPYQETDEFEVKAEHTPSVVARWLRRILVDDWNLKLLALAITLGLWLVVTGQNEPVTVRIRGVQLDLLHPKDMDISNDPPNSIDVILTGSQHKIDRITSQNLVATIDVGDHRLGESVVRLSADRVKMELPDGVKVEAFQPSAIPVRLELLVERQLDVDVKLEGNVPEGYQLNGVIVSPQTVRMRGPASHINALQKAPTETISLEGKKDSFDLSSVAIDIADDKVYLLDSLVNLHVDIAERAGKKSFSGVPVRFATGEEARPRMAYVNLTGPLSALSQLRAEDMEIVLDKSADGTIAARLELPTAIQEKIKLSSINPSSFSVLK
jgi:YbbR domain-containing protein